jgi:hypothetical protein
MMAALDGHNGIYHPAARTGQIILLPARFELYQFCVTPARP